jgi:hypothetical protein
MKCVVWYPQGVGLFYIIFSLFLTLDLSFHILGALMGFRSFVESFVIEAFHDDLGMIYNLPMFAIFKWILQCSHYVMHSTLTICFI